MEGIRNFSKRLFLSLLIVSAVCGSACSDDRSTTVGLPQTIEQLVLPGSELTVRPLAERNAPFLLRIIASYPHGTDHRYDLEYQALEPGEYNIAEYLQRADGSDVDSLPEILVRVESTLPEGQVVPTSSPKTRIPFFGGYRIAAGFAIFAWVLGLLLLIFWGRNGKTTPSVNESPTLSVIDQIRSLVDTARQGKLPSEQRAELERAVIAFWRDELEAEQLGPAELSERLRDHQLAGPMLLSLEQWLHAPDGDDSIDLAEVLNPIEQRLGRREDSAPSTALVGESTQ